ncbi:unnamed protein product, partial [Amoebophrya sp. A120]|eukprot:GSA120T00003914001.1
MKVSSTFGTFQVADDEKQNPFADTAGSASEGEAIALQRRKANGLLDEESDPFSDENEDALVRQLATETCCVCTTVHRELLEDGTAPGRQLAASSTTATCASDPPATVRLRLRKLAVAASTTTNTTVTTAEPLTIEEIEHLVFPKYSQCPMGTGNSTSSRMLQEVEGNGMKQADLEFQRAVFLNLIDLDVVSADEDHDQGTKNEDSKNAEHRILFPEHQAIVSAAAAAGGGSVVEESTTPSTGPSGELLLASRSLAVAASSSATATTTAPPDRCCCCPGFTPMTGGPSGGGGAAHRRTAVNTDDEDPAADERSPGELIHFGTEGKYRVETRFLAATADAKTNRCECGSELKRHIAWTAPLHEYRVYLNDTFNDPMMPHMGYYQPKHKFPYMQSAILDTLIYQTRYQLMLFPPAAYSSKISDPMAYNLDMDFTHGGFGQDAPKVVDLYDCVDRDHHESSSYDERIDTEGYDFHGEKVYARFANTGGTHSGRNIEADWWRIGWVDLQTHKVTVSTMVYTQMAEIFTSVAVEFEIDEAGNVIGLTRLMSYVDLDDYGTKGWFIFSNVMVIVFVSMGVVHSVYLITCGTKMTVSLWYELASRAFMLFFNLWLLIGFLGLKPMKEEYNDLMTTFFTLHDFSYKGLIGSIQHFLVVKDHVYEENDLIFLYRKVAFAVTLVSFLQMIQYLNVHPRVATLTSTILKSIDEMAHFFIVFAILFVVMAFIGHWQFASMLPADFGTFGRAVEWQFRMIIGDFPFDGWIELDTTQQLMYWLYLILFALIMFLTMMNFFLAIIVDAFVEVKQDIHDQKTENSFPFDCMDMFKDCSKYYTTRGYPNSREVLDALSEADEQDEIARRIYTKEKKKHDPDFHYPVTAKDLASYNLRSIETEAQAVEFLVRYGIKTPEIVFRTKGLMVFKKLSEMAKRDAGTLSPEALQAIYDATDQRGQRKQTGG